MTIFQESDVILFCYVGISVAITSMVQYHPNGVQCACSICKFCSLNFNEFCLPYFSRKYIIMSSYWWLGINLQVLYGKPIVRSISKGHHPNYHPSEPVRRNFLLIILNLIIFLFFFFIMLLYIFEWLISSRPAVLS